MDDDLRTSDLSSGTTNGLSGSASALSVAAVGAAFAGADEKKPSKVTKRFLVAEINRLLEENQQLKAAQEKYHDIDKQLVEQHRLMQVRTPPRYKFWGFARPSISILRIALLAVVVGAGAAAISNFDAAVFKKGTANIPTKPSNVPASALPDAVKPPSFSGEPTRAAANETDPTIGVQTEAVKTEPFSGGSKSQNTVTSFDDNNLAKQPEEQTSIDGQRSSNLAPAAAQQGQRDFPAPAPPDRSVLAPGKSNDWRAISSSSDPWASIVRYIFGQESRRPIPRQTKVAGSGGRPGHRSVLNQHSVVR